MANNILTDQSSFLAIFNVVVAFAGDVGVGVSLALTKNFIRNGLYRELAGTPNYEEVTSRSHIPSPPFPHIDLDLILQ